MTTARLLTLNDGHTLPALGLGTYSLNGAAGVEAITAAIRAGYRLLDTAFNYENEGTVGAAVRRCGVPRDDLVVTSKLAGRHHRYAQAMDAVHESVYRLGLDHLDLMLIHWPNPTEDRYVEAWQALVDCQRAGLLRSIGVSNFLPEHVDRIVEATSVTPAVNQIQVHPYWPQPDQLAANAARGIRVEAWSPLDKGGLLDEPVLAAVAEAVGRTPAQVVLRWHVQLGSVPIPRSSAPQRQAANLAVFDFQLDEAQVAAISALARPDGGGHWDPATHEEF
jgi:diketogulonate reductase-like aldo/keto reductase